MFYNGELQLLTETLRKSRVRTRTVSVTEFTSKGLDQITESFFQNDPLTDHQLFIEPAKQTLYRFTDPFDLSYLFFLLPEQAAPSVFVVGPYFSAPLTPARLSELGKEQGISLSRKAYFEEYYTNIPVLTEGSHLLVMITTFCEHIWNSPSFAIVDINKQNQVPRSLIIDSMKKDEFDDVLIDMKTIEKRYAFENEMIRAVTLGQLHKENQIFSNFSEQSFEKRLADPLRNAKNYGVIMNTLLRKAAEKGGVHPFYLDRMSSEVAAKIEQLHDHGEILSLMRDIFCSYCRLVRKHSLTHFSLVVQRTIVLIESDLSANLSLQYLARHLNVSHGYLSTIFRRDTGKTVSEYIRDKRIEHAMYLLATTHQQIQTIALHCGIMDVQYFSKTFKKLTGKTPKEYRESLKQPQNI